MLSWKVAAILAVTTGATGAGTPAARDRHRPAGPAATRPARHARDGQIRLIPAPTGNEARYHVREQLVSLSFPSDAVGATTGVTGAIVIGADGKIDAKESKITVDITALKSDRDRRDQYIQQRTLETDKYPTVVLAPTDIRGLNGGLPADGRFKFELGGDLTVHGVTKPTTWQVTGFARNGEYTGTASTVFTFEDFGLTIPTVSILFSVEDHIGLEYGFHLVRDTAATK